MQGTSRRVAVTISLLALLTLPIGTLIARAHTQTYQTNLTIHYDHQSGDFDGHVGSSSFCQEGRQITIYESGSNAVVGAAVSGHAGQWSGVSAPGPGAYYATVSEMQDSGYGHDHTCLEDASNTVTVK